MQRRIRLLLHAPVIEITTAIMPEFHHQCPLVQTNTDMITRHTERNVPICAAQVEPEHEYDYRDEGNYIPKYADYDQSLDQDDVDLTFATDMWVIAAERADGLERKIGKCFNCQEVGHYWRECPKPLKEDFKRLRDQPKRRQKELNGKGGPGKGG